MGSPVVPLPPRGYKVDPKPPPHYVMDPNAPISPDLEDRTKPSLSGKLAEWKTSAQEEWEAIKREPWFKGDPQPTLDKSFYNPANDASRSKK